MWAKVLCIGNKQKTNISIWVGTNKMKGKNLNTVFPCSHPPDILHLTQVESRNIFGEIF